MFLKRGGKLQRKKKRGVYNKRIRKLKGREGEQIRRKVEDMKMVEDIRMVYDATSLDSLISEANSRVTFESCRGWEIHVRLRRWRKFSKLYVRTSFETTCWHWPDSLLPRRTYFGEPCCSGVLATNDDGSKSMPLLYDQGYACGR